MVLSSMVPDSTFSDILGLLKSSEISYADHHEASRSFPPCTFIGANVSLDRICEIASMVSATIDKPDPLVDVPYDRLVIELHNSAGTYVSETKTAEVCLWGPYGETL